MGPVTGSWILIDPPSSAGSHLQNPNRPCAIQSAGCCTSCHTCHGVSCENVDKCMGTPGLSTLCKPCSASAPRRACMLWGCPQILADKRQEQFNGATGNSQSCGPLSTLTAEYSEACRAGEIEESAAHYRSQCLTSSQSFSGTVLGLRVGSGPWCFDSQCSASVR